MTAELLAFAGLLVVPGFVWIWVRNSLKKSGRTLFGMEAAWAADVIAGAVMVIFALLLYWLHQIRLNP